MKNAGAVLAVMIGTASLTVALSDDRPATPGRKSSAADPAVARATIEDARRQAQILHTAMHATLQTVHHRYYREDEGLPIPAAILKDVFAEVEKEQQVKLRWLAVEGQAMNSEHKPRDSFETDAFQALTSGMGAFERAEHGVYRRAAAIKLTNHCLKCHVPDRKSTADRTAGLIIAIPIRDK